MTAARKRAPKIAPPPLLEVGVFEHVYTWSTREASRRAVYGPRPTFTQHQVTCSCGWQSRWHRHRGQARRAAEAHAVDRQLAWEIGGDDAPA